ncbi:MAG: adenosylcobinamide-phosphate synthase CbiB [Hyphomicrobiales bacterium]|nr:adenosylcobinamide-phosphate synthase CbiB [Hyphomicrobiales bacterium]
MTLHFAAAALALLVERLFGYPKPLYDKIGHPVEWFGTVLKKLEALLYDPQAEPLQARIRGVAALLALLLIAAMPAILIASVLSSWKFGWIVEALLATMLLAQHSLYEHVNTVGKGLDISLNEGCKAVAKIVGRDPAALDESGVVKGALESLAENASDGIVAPVLWYALLGLPGIVAYKAINTADSMIGHKSERYIYFGWAAARLDDLINLPASRLTGFLFAAAAAWNDQERGKLAVRAMWRDAPKHQSPNAGWPESALAASLGVKFGGPRSYEGSRVDLPWMGEGRETLNRDDIRKGLRLYGTAMTFLLFLAVLCALLF